ncbi:SRPBCC domain-containing protein [Hyphomicrobium sp. CS1GBMeth3]|uniref:SRPBCC domain-containing protein n=1 Tax=Hyphomicrobium sp. CS1GBMeth3 TaxID=1892845 RepID=UPI00092FF445|nr:SRPBCC domain-containing protein [Hyphomicrobium sp. CS1GBMeth3]
MTEIRQGRTDSASRVLAASPDTIYQALVDPAAVAAWRPPAGMSARIDVFEPREGGRFRMALLYETGGSGKTTENADVVEGEFGELVPGARVVERVRFVSDDPAFAGEMTITTSLTPVAGGTRVAVVCENVPTGISAADHQVGLASTLANLATFTE